MNKQSARLQWIEGLRAIACLCIFAHHFFATFYPVTVYGTELAGASETTLALVQSPITVVLNGNFWVCVFCVMAGFVASLPRLSTPEKAQFALAKLSDSLIRRYLRLTLPTFCISVIVTLLYKLNVFSHLSFSARFDASWAALWYNEDIYTLKSLFLESFVRACFAGSDKYIVALWTISYLFYGYYVSVILAEISWGKSRKIIWVYIYIIFCCMLSGLRLCIMACFPIGTLLAYCAKNASREGRRPLRGIPIFLIIGTGLFLGAFPTYFKPSNLYRYLDLDFLKTDPGIVCHVMGAFLFMAGLCMSGPLRKMLSGKFFVWIGTISFSLYLVHIPVILTIGTRTALFLFDNGFENYHLVCLLTFVITICSVLFFSFLFWRWIERPCNRLARKVIDIFKAQPAERSLF